MQFPSLSSACRPCHMLMIPTCQSNSHDDSMLSNMIIWRRVHRTHMMIACWWYRADVSFGLTRSCCHYAFSKRACMPATRFTDRLQSVHAERSKDMVMFMPFPSSSQDDSMLMITWRCVGRAHKMIDVRMPMCPSKSHIDDSMDDRTIGDDTDFSIELTGW